MERFGILDAVAVPLRRPNIDTDQVVPSRFLQKPRTDNYGHYLFRDQRFGPDGAVRAEFALNQPAWRDARIVVAERNFGCGSSREQAVWALYDYGIRAVVAPSFGDIFQSNSLKNGLLPVVLPEATVQSLLAALEAQPGTHLRIDLERSDLLAPDGGVHAFTVPPFARQCMLNGQDELDYTLTLASSIADFERRYAAALGDER